VTTKKKVASTIDMVWSLEKEEYIPVLGKGSLELDVDRINPKLFDDGVLVIIDEKPEAKGKTSSKAKDVEPPAQGGN
jgi:hypothetical protein